MKKAIFIPCIIVIYLICSVVCFYSYTLLASNICNFASRNLLPSLLVTFASLSIALSLIAGLFLFVRVYKYPEHRKQNAIHYIKLIFIFSGIGVASSIAGPLMMYGTLVGDAPFVGYGVICLVINIVVAYISFIALGLIKQYLPEDEEKRKTTAKYRWICVFFGIFVFHASNRLGALLLAPTYVLGKNLNQTIFFYIYLLISTLFLEIYIADLVGAYDKHPLARVINTAVVIFINFLMFGLVVGIGWGNSEFISSISTALPLERLIAFPVELVLQLLLSTLLSSCILVYSIRIYKKSKN